MQRINLEHCDFFRNKFDRSSILRSMFQKENKEEKAFYEKLIPFFHWEVFKKLAKNFWQLVETAFCVSRGTPEKILFRKKNKIFYRRGTLRKTPSDFWRTLIDRVFNFAFFVFRGIFYREFFLLKQTCFFRHYQTVTGISPEFRRSSSSGLSTVHCKCPEEGCDKKSLFEKIIQVLIIAED